MTEISINALWRGAIKRRCAQVCTAKKVKLWFSADSVFNTEYESGILHGVYFITSSQFVPSDSDKPMPKKYQVRKINLRRRTIDTFVDTHTTLDSAIEAVEKDYENKQIRLTR